MKSKLYTGGGDNRETSLVGGKRVNKDSTQIEASGTIDELMAAIGWCRTLAASGGRESLGDQLTILQNELFDLGAELATAEERLNAGSASISDEQIKRTESWIDVLDGELPTLRSFVLPGGNDLNAALNLTRTVCRRAERICVKLSREKKVSANILIYLNRLSDLFFAMARYELHLAGLPEYLWQKSRG